MVRARTLHESCVFAEFNKGHDFDSRLGLIGFLAKMHLVKKRDRGSTFEIPDMRRHAFFSGLALHGE